jgi:precorrin-3B C17-methyltransferase
MSEKILYVIGMGPGCKEQMTGEAKEIIGQCEVIVGYSVYADLVRKYYPAKQYLTTGMKQEIERCHMALKSADSGKITGMVCSGDSGVYGMAGILLELGVEYPDVRIQVVAGVTAALSGGAILGAPLGHDFAIISLSDLLTPWEKIVTRLRCAAMADMVICLYNPSSKKRADYLDKACQIIAKYQSPDTVCGYVRNIGREGQMSRIVTLEQLAEISVDMFTTVFIGNSQTKKIGDKMVTPRGYQVEEKG